MTITRRASAVAWLVGVLGAGLALGGQAAATPGASPIEVLLGGYEHVPSAEEWARVAKAQPDVPRLLMAIASDGSRDSVTRGRALSSLAHFPTPAVRSYLGARMEDPTWPTRLRGKAVIALALSHRDAAAARIGGLIADSDPRLREDIARGLRLMSAPSVERFLNRQADKEPTPHLREALARAASSVARNRAERLARKQPVPTVTMPTLK